MEKGQLTTTKVVGMTPDFTVGVHLYLLLLFGGGQNAMGRLKSALLVIFFAVSISGWPQATPIHSA